MLRTFLIAGVALAAFASANAQNWDEGEPVDEATDAPAAADELDFLSRAPDDPFASFEEEVKRRPISVTIRALNKITARYTDIETKIGEPATFGSLEIKPHYCDKRPPEEFPETTAFFEIFDRDLSLSRSSAVAEAKGNPNGAAPGDDESESEAAPDTDPAEAARSAALEDILASQPEDPDRIFSGWMFASSPALNALEHPVYDVWVIDCKTEIVED